jgi:epsilon-lactone hydrolase
MRTSAICRPFVIAVLLALHAACFAQEFNTGIPATISPEWREYLARLKDPRLMPAFPAAGDTAAWRVLRGHAEVRGLARSQTVVAQYTPDILHDTLGGVPVLDIRPKNIADTGKIIVYLHGGAYTLLSARSTLNISTLMAVTSGLRIICIDYTLAPQGTWEQVIDEVVRVCGALLRKGYNFRNLALFGDSAGGGLAAGSALKMRDLGMGLPGAIVLWSPWADLSGAGDTYISLQNFDPVLSYTAILQPSAAAYAPEADRKQPYVSPVYGDFRDGFPPMLIQGGTREILLSDFVRLYRASTEHGNIAVLDLYEGMVHNFQSQLPDSDEARAALKKCAEFLKSHLNY